MWMEKLAQGVLRVLTPLGPRYVQPSFIQRIYLLWIFRNFATLPFSVLTPRQQHRMDRMCAQHGFVSVLINHALIDIPILGTLEQRPPMQEGFPPRRPSESVSQSVAPFAADINQQ